MSEKKVILFWEESFSKRAKYLALFMGIVFTASGILTLSKDNPGVFESIFAGIQLFFGISYPLYIIVFLKPSSKYTPKAVIEDDTVSIKMGMFKKPEIVDLNKIDKIEFGIYRVTFYKSKEPRDFRYNASDEASISLKRAIREAAEVRGIPVLGG